MSRSLSNFGPVSAGQRRVWLLVLSAVLVLMMVQYARLLAAQISYSEAIQDRECGGDTLWSIWKQMYGYPVYSDAWELPFSSSNYNYLFYAFYAYLNLFVMKVLHLGDEWMQVISSHVSLVVSLFGMWCFFRSAKVVLGDKAAQAGGALARVALACAAVAVVFGPVMEDMPTAQRPDPGGFALQMLAFLLMVSRERAQKRTDASLVPVVVACYLSWAFRQTCVELPVAYVLYLATGRRWKEIALYSLGLWALFGATYWFMRDTFYWQNTVFVPTLEDWSLRGMIRPFVHLAGKAPQSIAGLVIIVWSLASRQRRTGVSRLLLFAGVVAFVIDLLTSSKPGAHSHYYWPFSAYAMLLLLEAVFVSPEDQPDDRATLKRARFHSALFLGTFVMLGAAAIYGIKTRKADRHEHFAAVQLRASLEGLPRPVYVTNSWLFNQPWLIRSDMPIVRAWLHNRLQKTGRKPPYGGIDGLTQAGYFGTIAVPVEAAPDDPQMQAIAMHYDKVKADGYHTYWTRKPGVVPPEIKAPVYQWPARQ